MPEAATLTREARNLLSFLRMTDDAVAIAKDVRPTQAWLINAKGIACHLAPHEQAAARELLRAGLLGILVEKPTSIHYRALS